MTHRIRVTADRHEQPDLDQFVAALLAWALAEVADDEESEGDAAESAAEAGREGADD